MSGDPKFFVDGAEVVDAESISVDGDLVVDGEITNTAGNLVIDPVGYTKFGSLSDSSRGMGADDVHFSGDIEVDGGIRADGALTMSAGALVINNQTLSFGSGANVPLRYSTSQTNSAMLVGLPTTSLSWIFVDKLDIAVDFQHAPSATPVIFIHDSDATDVTKYAQICNTCLSVGPGNGAFAGIKAASEAVSIAAGTGAAGINTTGDLAPENSLLIGVGVRVTTAPGGGATTFDVGITGSGNPDELIDALSTAVTTTGASAGDNDGTQLPLSNGTATTLTVTTDANVTGATMVVRVSVFYIDLTPPAS